MLLGKANFRKLTILVKVNVNKTLKSKKIDEKMFGLETGCILLVLSIIFNIVVSS